MRNRIIDYIKDRRRYRRIMNQINRGNFKDVLGSYNVGNNPLGFETKEFSERAVSALDLAISTNMGIFDELDYYQKSLFIKEFVSRNPNMIESVIENSKIDFHFAGEIIRVAMQGGYSPSEEYVNTHIDLFNFKVVMESLIENGYRPSDQLIELKLERIFSDREMLLKALAFGFKPSTTFLRTHEQLLRDEEVLINLFNSIELNNEIINTVFVDNAVAQREIIARNPNLLATLKINIYNDDEFRSARQIILEALKQDIIYEPLLEDYFIASNFGMMKKFIEKRPEYIKYCQIINQKERDNLDEYALAMGYVPTLEDMQTHEYIRNSHKLMEIVIKQRPEAIKYLTNENSKIKEEKFDDLVRLALENGYIPTEQDFKDNERFSKNFRIMNEMIKRNPNYIEMCEYDIPNKEMLLNSAIDNGYTGNIPSIFKDTELGIRYTIVKGERLYFSNDWVSGYSLNLYNFMMENGIGVEECKYLFLQNPEVVKEMVKTNPYIIKELKDIEFSEIDVDEICENAIAAGYKPDLDDEILGCGYEITKKILIEHPEFIEKVKLYKGFLRERKKSPYYNEFCAMAMAGGYIPDWQKLGNGFGGSSDTKYNDSYDVMKKVIPLNPSLIESCQVEDKRQYDELCRLAIESGYVFKNEFAFSHWGINMRKNLDLMKQVIDVNVDLIIDSELKDEEEFKVLFNYAIEKGFDIEGVNEKDLLKVFLPFSEELWNEILPEDKVKILKKAKKLHLFNEDISQTLHQGFLNDSNEQHFTDNQIEILSNYPKLQEKITSLRGVKLDVVYKIAEEYKDDLKWIGIIERALNNIDSFDYSALFKDLELNGNSDKSADYSSNTKNNIPENQMKKLIYILTTDNHYNITTIDELERLDEIRKANIEELKKRGTLGAIKSAYLEETYGIDFSFALELIEKYGESLNSSSINGLAEESRRLFKMLKDMKSVININDVNILKRYLKTLDADKVHDPMEMVTFETELKVSFIDEFNKSLNKPQDVDKIQTENREEDGFNIYMAAGQNGDKKCRMMITSIGAYTNMPEPDDYYSSWNVAKMASHGCCCSYVGESNLGTARVKYCCFGFTDYENGALHLAGPYDLASFSNDKSFEVTAFHQSMYLFPDEMLEHTRHTHNEMVWERRNISAENVVKKQPSYIVYFVDNFSDRLVDGEAKTQWESVKKAANDFGVEVNGIKQSLPIMVVEREKIAQNQRKQIDKNLEKFEQTLDKSLIKDIVVAYESNYAGNREYHKNIGDKYFPKVEQLSEAPVGRILAAIKKSENKQLQIACLQELERVVYKEKEKYLDADQDLVESIPSFYIEEALNQIKTTKERIQSNDKSILVQIQNMGDASSRQFEQTDVKRLTPELKNSQLSVADIQNIINNANVSESVRRVETEIHDEGINRNLLVHGKRHIIDVMMFSTIIGNEILEDSKDRELLLMAAKYHDSARITDAHEKHAESSACFAIEQLKDKYQAEDLAIIKTAIEFHEVFRNGTDYEDEVFTEMATNNGVTQENIERTRKIAEILKDADALDRTRFINKARINPKMLRFDFSKRLVEFSAELQESYAIQDLQSYGKDRELDIILKFHTPQEALRTIRHSTRGLKKAEVYDFIDSWSQAEGAEIDETMIGKKVLSSAMLATNGIREGIIKSQFEQLVRETTIDVSKHNNYEI